MMNLNLEKFTIQPFRNKRLKPYFDYYSQDRDKVIFDDRVAKVLEAQGFSAVESPRSVYEVDQLFSSLAKYAPGRVKDPKLSPDTARGVQLARACFSRPSEGETLTILPFTAETVALVTSNPSGSPGLTAFGSTKAESMTRALERGIQTLSGEKAPEPCIGFSRTQFENKTRLVWGFPYSMTVIEGLLAYPLLEKFKGGNTPMAFAMTTMHLGTKLVTASYHSEWSYSIDMSAFDASISSYLINQAFDILQTWFNLDDVEPRSGLLVREVFEVVRRYFITAPIVMPDGNIYKGRRHGVPSGSFFTQMIDSIVNVIIAGTISSRFSMNVDKSEVFVLGDDLLMWSNRDVSLDVISRYATEVFGVQFNAAKSKKMRYTEPVQYLGRVWTNGLPDLDVSEILKRMVYPERFRKYSADPDYAERQVRLLIMSFAAQYWTALSIAQRVYGSTTWYNKGGAMLDIHTYRASGGRDLRVSEEHLSGLERYMRKYIRKGAVRSMPHTALLYGM